MIRILLCASAAAITLAAMAAGAFAFEVKPIAVVEMKAVYGRVESRFVIPARSRIGGTLVDLAVTEGSVVSAGKPIARVVDEKLALQIAAIDARIRAATSELGNARAEYERVQALMARGATTQQRIDQARTQVDVLVSQVAQAGAERAVVVQQGQEGEVLSPADGRVLTVPARRGAVVMPGEPVAVVAGGGLFLRLAIPERHAATLKPGAEVALDAQDGASRARPRTGRIEKVYPQIENGRVIVDVAVEGLEGALVGERVLVQAPVAERTMLAVPPEAIVSRAGLDMVRIATGFGPREVAVVIGALVDTAEGPRREVLTGLKAGDRVVAP
jgi:RND family efflux transporter MFP subunit